MATLYAQSNHSWSARSGKWATTAGGGTLQDPTSADTLNANGRTITIDTNLTAVEINTIAAGGSWIPVHNIIINANVVAGTTTCVVYNALGSGTCTINGNVSASSTNTNAYGASTSSTSGTLTVNGDVYGGGSLVQVGTSATTNGIFANGTASSIVILQGGTIYGGINGSAVIHLGGTLRIYSNIKATSSIAAVSLQRTAANTIEIGTPQNPVIISSGDKPFNGNGLRIETTAVNTTINIHCGGLNALGGAAMSVNGNPAIVNITMYGGAVVKGGQISCITFVTSGGAFTINGDVYGSDYSHGGNGVNMAATATLTVNGDVYGGQTMYGTINHGINVNGVAATVIVNGTAYAGICSSSSGIFKTGAGAAVIRVRKAVGSSFGNWLYSSDAPTALAGSYGVDTNFDIPTTLTVGSVVNGPYGGAAIRGAYIMSPTINSVTVPCFNQRRESPNGPTSTTISYTFGVGSTSYMPNESDVLASYTYGVTASPTTGTLAVPSASDVLYGAPTGTTTGTATVTPADILNYPVSSVSAGTVGERVARTLTSEELAAILEAQPN